MRILKILSNRYFAQELEDDDVKKFKVMIKHINGKDTEFSVTSDGMEFIISNDKTHYDLLINDTGIQLVNTKDIIDIHVSDRIKQKVLNRVQSNINKERRARIQKILSRKENTLDNILSKMN